MIAVKDPATDGLLVILAPTGLTDPTAIAEQMTHYAQASRQAGDRQLDGRPQKSRKGTRFSIKPAFPPTPIPTRPRACSI